MATTIQDIAKYMGLSTAAVFLAKGRPLPSLRSVLPTALALRESCGTR